MKGAVGEYFGGLLYTESSRLNEMDKYKGMGSGGEYVVRNMNIEF